LIGRELSNFVLFLPTDGGMRFYTRKPVAVAQAAVTSKSSQTRRANNGLEVTKGTKNVLMARVLASAPVDRNAEPQRKAAATSNDFSNTEIYATKIQAVSL
jgi:hypothetical protein